MQTIKLRYWLAYYLVALFLVFAAPVLFHAPGAPLLEPRVSWLEMSGPIASFMALGFLVLLWPFGKTMIALAFGGKGAMIMVPVLCCWLLAPLHFMAQTAVHAINNETLGPVQQKTLTLKHLLSHAGKHGVVQYDVALTSGDPALQPYLDDLKVRKAAYDLLQTQMGQPVVVKYAVGRFGAPVFFSLAPVASHFLPVGRTATS